MSGSSGGGSDISGVRTVDAVEAVSPALLVFPEHAVPTNNKAIARGAIPDVSFIGPVSGRLISTV
ncbi:hypothetical protein MHPYR_190059 [uncultured Mycobacterium sp.]|uniref:Uncharacterized protein n=1 Tax=uncultured Mycobacterium sp. TaxID=171292 RepID=A0A1Y5P659_9MYCO|nr:hypothetical protein MHPYR_190059 [uncultured Mycobacterium sp.]